MTDVPIMSFFAVLALAYLGAYAHWYKMKRAKRIEGKFLDYLIADRADKSAYAGLAILASTWQMASSGTADLVNPELLWSMLSQGILHGASISAMVLFIGMGYALDSGLNGTEK